MVHIPQIYASQNHRLLVAHLFQDRQYFIFILGLAFQEDDISSFRVHQQSVLVSFKLSRLMHIHPRALLPELLERILEFA